MEKPKVLISILSKEDTESIECGQRVLSLFYDEYPKLAPEFAGFYEPIKNPISNTDEALEYWKDMLWKRKHAVKGEGYISHRKYGRMGSFSFEYHWNKKIDWFKLFQELVVAFKAEYAYLHLFTDPEIFGAILGSPQHDFQLGVCDHALKNGIQILDGQTILVDNMPIRLISIY